MAGLNALRKPQLPPQGGVAPAAFEPSNTLRTHEGAPAATITAEQQLRRSVCSCLLWENEFYEGGQEIAARIEGLVRQVPRDVVINLALDARSNFNLRHAPLLLCAALAKYHPGSRDVGDAIAGVIQRADEISEMVAVVAKLNDVTPGAVRKKLSAQMKRGLALAWRKFDRYQLAKYFSASGEKAAAIKGRDVMFMTHPNPNAASRFHNTELEDLFRLIANREPVVAGGADTWEVSLSKGADKRETFERLLRDGKLGYLALLRNLRNMEQAGVDGDLVCGAILARRGAHRVLPFRYVAAARAAPSFAPQLSQALDAAIADVMPLSGRTVVLVDVSGSMDAKLSARSDLTRMDAAATLAAVIPGDVRIFTFSDDVVECSGERGLAAIGRIIRSQPHQGTYLGQAIAALTGAAQPMGADVYGYRHKVKLAPVPMDRLIVITDEQAHDHVAPPFGVRRAYMINVASAKNGVGYGPAWTHIDGFSEQVLRFIAEFEVL